jgi:hypothetical protein
MKQSLPSFPTSWLLVRDSRSFEETRLWYRLQPQGAQGGRGDSVRLIGNLNLRSKWGKGACGLPIGKKRLNIISDTELQLDSNWKYTIHSYDQRQFRSSRNRDQREISNCGGSCCDLANSIGGKPGGNSYQSYGISDSGTAAQKRNIAAGNWRPQNSWTSL